MDFSIGLLVDGSYNWCRQNNIPNRAKPYNENLFWQIRFFCKNIKPCLIPTALPFEFYVMVIFLLLHHDFY